MGKRNKENKVHKEPHKCECCGQLVTESYYLTTQQCAAMLSMGTTDFLALVKQHLPMMRIVKLSRNTERWSMKDVDCLLHILQMSTMVQDYKRGRKVAIPSKLPDDFSLPNKLVPMRDRLTMDYDGPCIYFLFLRGVVQYVGLTIEPKRRVKQHAQGSSTTAAKEFDAFLFYPVPIEEIFQAERTFIVLLDPPLNQQHKGKVFTLPVVEESVCGTTD